MMKNCSRIKQRVSLLIRVLAVATTTINTVVLALPKCDLNCMNGGTCSYISEDVETLATAFQSGILIKQCVCPPGYIGIGCELYQPVQQCRLSDNTCYNGMECLLLSDDVTRSCKCAIASTVSSFAKQMCIKTYTEYCNAQLDISDTTISFCTNGGKCKSGIIAAQVAPRNTSVNLLYQHEGCECPPEFYGPHCEFLRHASQRGSFEEQSIEEHTPLSSLVITDTNNDQQGTTVTTTGDAKLDELLNNAIMGSNNASAVNNIDEIRGNNNDINSSPHGNADDQDAEISINNEQSSYGINPRDPAEDVLINPAYPHEEMNDHTSKPENIQTTSSTVSNETSDWDKFMTSNAAYIVAGVLGFIAFTISAIVICLCCKKLQKSTESSDASILSHSPNIPRKNKSIADTNTRRLLRNESQLPYKQKQNTSLNRSFNTGKNYSLYKEVDSGILDEVEKGSPVEFFSEKASMYGTSRKEISSKKMTIRFDDQFSDVYTVSSDKYSRGCMSLTVSPQCHFASTKSRQNKTGTLSVAPDSSTRKTKNKQNIDKNNKRMDLNGFKSSMLVTKNKINGARGENSKKLKQLASQRKAIPRDISKRTREAARDNQEVEEVYVLDDDSCEHNGLDAYLVD